MKNNHDSYNRQDWNNENHADRIGWKPGIYLCPELMSWLAEHPELDTPLIRWYISTQNGTGTKHDRPENSPF